MNDTITNLIADIRNWEKNAKKNSVEPMLAEVCSGLVPVLDSIATRLEQLVKDGFYVTPEAARKFAEEQKDIMDGKGLNAILANPPFDCKLKMPVISMPGKAAIKYQVDDPELPRLAASIETIKSGSGKVSCDCTLYAGNEVLADMQVYRGKSFATAMVRRALKGAMSKFGKRRRMTANRAARKSAASPVSPVLPAKNKEAPNA